VKLYTERNVPSECKFCDGESKVCQQVGYFYSAQDQKVPIGGAEISKFQSVEQKSF